MASAQPHRFKRSDFLDSHKAVTPLAILAMMAFYQEWNHTAWIYLATHGTYALLWVYKGFTFPDRQFLVPCSIPYGVFYVWLPLSLYWIAGWLVMSRHVQAPPWYLAMCVSLTATGIFFHYVGDMQKHMHMQYRKGTLLTEGVWAGCRNPNYFGELLIYLGFGLLAMHWLPMAILGTMVVGLWVPNMRLKDKSMSRYPEFAAWKARTGKIVPYLL